MSDVRQVKVDNWGIYFLQRLKHFFNRTDYCDLTLQFQDNAQLKVHRLVLNACTEYFELLERTCEMYEDCLVMPDDLQADVVVPIVNFMYTGHLEFRMDILERLYQTSQILNMPVLTKLLESHRKTPKTHTHNFNAVKKTIINEPKGTIKPTPSSSSKRSYSKAFDTNNIVYREKKVYQPPKMRDAPVATTSYRSCSPVHVDPMEPLPSLKKNLIGDRRPTRYELPEELDADNVFDNSFCNISYTCKPLMIHPETVKRYSAKHSAIFNDKSSSKKLIPGVSTLEIAECKRITKENHIFDDSITDHSLNDDLEIFPQSYNETAKDSSQLFDQIIDDGPKVTIETKDNKAASNLDHAKIISEVLKKYPHLVKSNKNIKLKILNTPNKAKKLRKQLSPTYVEERPNIKTEVPDYTYETDVIDSQQAAKLIAMGAENTKGPWICLICGTPGKALHFTSYYKFRRHLVEVHNEKPISTMCEYCGLRAQKRHYLLYHLYTQHHITPPPRYHFPKCEKCNYIALTEVLLSKHKLTHSKIKSFFCCNVCSQTFKSTDKLLQHIQATGHKFSAEKKTNLQCIYCLKTFLRHGNLYAHMKSSHQKEAKRDGVIDDSDEDMNLNEISVADPVPREGKCHHVKFEPSTSYDIYSNETIFDEEVDVQYEIQQSHDGNIQVSPKKQHQHLISNQQNISNSNSPKQKILNPGIVTPKSLQKPIPVRTKPLESRNTFLEDVNIPSPPASDQTNEEIVIIDNVEYIMKNNQLIPRKPTSSNNEYIISDVIDTASLQATSSMEYTNVHNTNIIQSVQPAVMVKKTQNINQPIQIVVSNEEEYKALMASNHPILFNNSDPSKTLTVLTTPHNNTMESTSIELNNTQSNDMMIIPEDYPLNVTETVSTDNSNIVVVYSHPIDTQNKEFQILTTGGIGSQFAQSSAIITQNYETITTSAPVMSAVLESQPDTSWQDNIESANAEILPIVQHNNPPQSEIHNDEMKSLQSETISSLRDLPEVHLTPSIQPMVPENDLPNDVSNEGNVIHTITQSVEQEVIEAEAQNMPETQMEPEILRENIIEEATTAVEPIVISHIDVHIPEAVNNDISSDINIQEPILNENVVLQHENIVLQNEDVITQTDNIVLQNENIVEENEIVVMQNENEIVQNENVIEQNENAVLHNEEVAVQNENVVEETEAEITKLLPQEQIAVSDNSVPVDIVTNEHPEITENEEIGNTVNEQPLHSQAYDDIVQINHDAVEESQTGAKADDKIQNLTSEWSEDEDEVPHASSDIQNSKVIRHADSEMLEESIENIQQEVLNPVIKPTPAAIIETVPEADIEQDDSVAEDSTSSPEESQKDVPATIERNIAPVTNDVEAQEKISSLLNDWEDNDSQEESEENKEEETTILNKAKPDIKSLVSDWDEEEDEYKEQ